MFYNRQTGASPGDTITLYAIFTDDAGALKDPDSLPEVYLYDPEAVYEEVEEALLLADYSGAAEGPLEPERISTGYYKLEYEIPSGALEGTWLDVWVGAVDGVSFFNILSYISNAGLSVSPQNIGNNTLVLIKLRKEITASETGHVLEDDTSLYFTTMYSPLYASPTLVRLELGRWVESFPEDTLALMLHWSSQECDAISYPGASGRNLGFARTKFCVFDTALRLLTMPGAGLVDALETIGLGKKMLGDLSITKNNLTPAEVDSETFGWLKKQREEWWRVVNSGGTIVPGEGLGPVTAKPGELSPDRMNIGRLWDSPFERDYAQPTVNGKGPSYTSDGRLRSRERFNYNGMLLPFQRRRR